MRRALSMLLAFALLLGMAVPALASEKGRSKFKDVPDDDWSVPYVLEMNAKGLMRGTGDGRFEPQAPLTRSQAVTVAVRLMGLENEALALDPVPDTRLPFADRKEIAGWARPYVALAVEEDILPVAEDGLFRPEEKASRLWVSVLLVRALGYDAEAQSKMNDRLSFKDAALIPASLVGYVSAAVDHELVEGFPDRTFQPNHPLTRAQAAALLSRTDSQLGDLGRLRPGVMVGELVRVRSQVITMTVGGRERDVTVDRNAFVFLENRAVSLSDLPVGVKLSLVLDVDGKALLVIARAPEKDVSKNEVRGEITSLFLPSEMAGGLGLIVIDPSSGSERSFPLAPSIAVSYQGRSISLDDLRVGDDVKLRVAAGVAVSIEVEKRAAQPPEERETEITGTVTEVRPYSITFLGSIDIRTSRGTRSVQVAPGAVITSDGDRIELTDVQEGDKVTVKLVGDVAVRITVDVPVQREVQVTGLIQAIYPTSSKTVVELKTSKGVSRIALGSDVVIRYGSKRWQIDDLWVGDKVTVTLINGTATAVKVESIAPREKVEEVKGEITAIYPFSISFQSSIDVKNSSGVHSLLLAPEVSIRHGSKRLALDDLREGDKVTVKLVNDVATEIKVDSMAPREKVEEVKGEITAIYPFSISFQSSIDVKNSSGVRNLLLAPEVSIRHGSRQLELDDLREGDKVTVKLVNDVATEIKVDTMAPRENVEEVSGTIQAVYPVSISFQASIEVKADSGVRTLLLAPEVAITRGSMQLDLDDLLEGDRVSVTVVNDVATKIKVEDRTTEREGTIVGIFEREVTLRLSNSRELETLTLAEDAVLTYKERRITVDELFTGDKVEVRVQGNLILSLDVESRGVRSRDDD